MMRLTRTISVGLSLSLACIAMAACSSLSQEEAYRLPDSYEKGMAEMQVRAVSLNERLLGSRFDEGKNEAFILLNITRHLENYRPEQRVKHVSDYEEYLQQLEDLHRTSDWLHYYTRLRRKDDAVEKLEEFVDRYNRLTTTYGPGLPLVLSKIETGQVPLPATYRGIIPGDRIYR